MRLVVCLIDAKGIENTPLGLESAIPDDVPSSREDCEKGSRICLRCVEV